ncbi:MAG: ABC transporter permease [Chitinophagaceae bacterium]|nr:ABC transporter permease [Chitinophagaceae bacterium]
MSIPMWSVCKKELRQFFSSLTGYIAIIVFLLVNGVLLFFFRDNIFDFGYATLDRFFQLAPWILLLLIPAISMRSFAEEFKTGTFEILQTRPLSRSQIVWGKYLGSLIVVLIALLPTLVYIISIQKLSAGEGIDMGATIGPISVFFSWPLYSLPSVSAAAVLPIIQSSLLLPVYLVVPCYIMGSMRSANCLRYRVEQIIMWKWRVLIFITGVSAAD